MTMLAIFFTSLVILLVAPFSGALHQRRCESDRADMYVFFGALAIAFITGTTLLMHLFMN